MAGFCTNCGAPLADGANFCDTCGARATIPEPDRPEKPNAAPTGMSGLPAGIEPDENGAFRWVYLQNMWKHTEVLDTVLKLFFGIFGAIFLILVLPGAENLSSVLLVFLAIYGVIALISVIAWAVVNLLHHGKQYLLFTMAEDKIVYELLPESAEIAGQIGLAAMLAGNPGAGLAAANQTLASEYGSVKKLKAEPKRDLIRVNSTLTRNMIYCSPAQYEFVWYYLTTHCPGAKIVRYS